MASWGLGNAYWEHNLASGVSLPNPSPADAGYLAFYPLVYLAVIAARRRQSHHLGVGLWLDGMIGAAACATLGAVFVLEPVLKGTEGESVAGALTNIAYPIGDLTLLAMLVVTTATVGWRGARGLPSGRAIVPGIAGLLALAVLGVQPFTSLNTTSLVCALLTLALVVTRMTLSLQETAGLLVAREREATLDPLTGLANRRILLSDLRKQAADASEWHPTLLVMFDLDGFKAYNDTFGHGAGDSLLIQVAGSLTEALGDRGRAYRLGGDEFCALLSVAPHAPELAGEELATAMSQQGEGFLVTASYGCALAPTDGRDTTALLRRADDEMYARKGRRRPGTENQIQDVLIAALSARDPGMKSHATDVASLAAILGKRLGLGPTELRTLSHAAALHDIGKIAIPDELLDKTTELDPRERRFLQTHPLIAQRIVSAAPALASAAQIVRSVQERWDGGGYPDGLIGEAIPLASRIIAVCNAYNAMTRPQTRREALSQEQAVAELERSAGTQFDPRLVETLVEVLAHPPEAPAPAPPTPSQTADLLVSREAAARRRLEAQLSYQSDHDPLTGLLNRRRFSEELERVLRYASRYGRTGALVMLDLDNLKLLNDIHGHTAGDDAVKLVAREILGRVRTTDIVARLGGDEFAIALHEADEQRALAVAQDIRARLYECELDPPLQMSMGIALFEEDQELVADDLLTAADVALYDAKEAGRGQIRVYHGDAGAALGWVQRIRDALAQERFVLYAQPIVDLRNGKAAHRELLVRMLTDDGDTIPPDAFIPTAERFGMINDLDRWVTRQGLALAREGEGVSINLSAHSIGDPRIREVTSNPTDQQVVKSITEVGHSLDKLIVAEGVEDRATLDALRGYGVDYAQGFYLGVPERVSPPTRFERTLPASPTAHDVPKAG